MNLKSIFQRSRRWIGACLYLALMSQAFFTPSQVGLPAMSRATALSASHQASLALPAGTRPGYLIIAPQFLVDSDVFEYFMHFKTGLGYNIYKSSIESITAVQPGVDDPEKIRNYLKYVYEPRTVGPANIRYLLLVGEHDVINHRQIYPRWGPTDTVQTAGVAWTDWYYADLTGDWDSNGDGNFGQAILLDDPIDQADLHYEIAVGRLPFSNASNVEDSLYNIVSTELHGSAWKQNVLLAAAFM